MINPTLARPDEPTVRELTQRAFALVDAYDAEHKAGVDTALARARLLAAVTDLSGAAARYDVTKEQARCWATLEQHAEEVVMRGKNGKIRVKWSGTEPFGARLMRVVTAIGSPA